MIKNLKVIHDVNKDRGYFSAYITAQIWDDVYGWHTMNCSGSTINDAIRRLSEYSVTANTPKHRLEVQGMVEGIKRDYATRTYHGD